MTLKNRKKYFTYIKLLLGLTSLTCVFAGLFHSLEKNGFFNITQVDIEINYEENQSSSQQKYTGPRARELERKLEKLNGESLLAVNMKSIESQLSENSWIKNYYIKRTWPQKLSITITPQRIYYLLVDPQGRLFPVISDGKILSEINMSEVPDVPILRGNNFITLKELRKKAVNFMDSIPNEGHLSLNTVSQVSHNKEDGFVVELMQTHVQIKMGEDNFQLKTERVEQVLDYMIRKQLNGKIIDATLSKKVLVKVDKNFH